MLLTKKSPTGFCGLSCAAPHRTLHTRRVPLPAAHLSRSLMQPHARWQEPGRDLLPEQPTAEPLHDAGATRRPLAVRLAPPASCLRSAPRRPLPLIALRCAQMGVGPGDECGEGEVRSVPAAAALHLALHLRGPRRPYRDARAPPPSPAAARRPSAAARASRRGLAGF